MLYLQSFFFSLSRTSAHWYHVDTDLYRVRVFKVQGNKMRGTINLDMSKKKRKQAIQFRVMLDFKMQYPELVYDLAKTVIPPTPAK